MGEVFLTFAVLYSACIFGDYSPRLRNRNLKLWTMALYVSYVVFVRAYRMHSPLIIALYIFGGCVDVKCKYWYNTIQV